MEVSEFIEHAMSNGIRFLVRGPRRSGLELFLDGPNEVFEYLQDPRAFFCKKYEVSEELYEKWVSFLNKEIKSPTCSGKRVNGKRCGYKLWKSYMSLYDVRSSYETGRWRCWSCK